MARIKIEVPEKVSGKFTIPIRITDINYGNHMGNDALVSILHETRMQWLVTNGFSELDVAGTSLIMADLAVEYKGEAFYGDVLEIEVSVDQISARGFDLYYSVKNKDEKLIALAKTGMLCFDYNTRKVARIPERFLKFLQQ